MNIMPLNTTNYNSLSFKSYSTKAYNKAADKVYYTSTCFFREDLNWEQLMQFLLKKYSNVNKVNTIVHACSNGEEAYSLALKYLELGIKGRQFSDIIAKDFDHDAINKARSGVFEVTNEELNRIVLNMKHKFSTYFQPPQKAFWGNEEGAMISPNKTLKDMVRFSCSDILGDAYNLPPENTVLFCRNFWPYMQKEDAYLLASRLGARLKPSSVIVLGNFDEAYNIDTLLKNFGFKQTECPLVMSKTADV